MNMRGKYRIKEKFGLTIVPKKRIEKEVHYIGEKSTFLKPPQTPINRKIKTKKTWTMFGNSCRRRLHFLNIRRLFPYQDHPPVCHPLLLSIIPLFFLSLAPTLLYNVRNTPGRKLLASLFCHA